MLTFSRLLRRTRLDREDGQAIPFFAVAGIAMMLMTGFVIDSGNLFQNRQSLQNAADASAIAGAEFMADSTKPCYGAATIGACAGKYAGLNGSTNANGTVTTQLGQCDNNTVTATTPPPSPPGCYVYPYTFNGNNNNVEVWLTRTTSNFFGALLGHGTSTESARAVGTLTAGAPPPLTFAALENTASCDNHTLLIKLGGILTVNQSIYVNSCNVPQDAFDVFNGGSIRAPSILVHGGWETHDDSTVWTTGAGQTWPQITQCLPAVQNPNSSLYYNNGSKTFQTPPPNGCPVDGVPLLTDPFADFPPVPTFGPGNVGTPVTITKVSRGLNTDPANVARVVTASPHGFAVGNSVTISNVGSGFDGAYTVASVPNSTTFTYANNGPNLPIITQKQMSGGVATLTTNAPTTLTVGEHDLTVLGIDTVFNIVNATVTAIGSNFFSYAPPAYTLNVTKKQLQGGTATLTVNTNTGLAVGDKVTVAGVDPLLNGSFTLTGVMGGNMITYADNASQQVAVTSRSIAGSTMATITTANTYTFANGEQVTVNTGDARFDGSYTAGGGSGPGMLKYTIPAVAPTVTNAGAGPAATPAVANGTVVLTLASFPGFEAGDTVTLPAGLGSVYGSGNVTLTGFSSPAKTIAYAAPTVMSMGMSTRSGTTVTFTTMGGAHGLKAGNTVNIAGFDAAHNCFNVGNTTVNAVPTATTFTFTVPGSCVPAGGGMNGTVKLISAASAAASGTATLVSTPNPSISGSGTVTAPATVAATNITCNNCVTLTDVPATAASGTFTPAWMPTSLGVVAQNFPGSPGIPSPKEIPSGTVTLNPGTYYGGICIGAASGSNCVGTNCAAAGGTTTTIQSYSPVVDLAAPVPSNSDATNGMTTIQVNHTGISTGDLIAIDDEEMTVTGVSGLTISVTREANGTEDGPHTTGTQVFHVVTTKNATPYPTAVMVNAMGLPMNQITAAQTSVPIQWGGPNMNTDPVNVNDVIQINSEDMLVTGETPAAMGKATLTVMRGYFSTTPATHQNMAPVLNASSGSAASVTLNPGVYIMAGGGFSVCGAANMNAPHGVMIYNTNDSASPGGNGALGQVDINTSGNVHLHPMTSGIYAGMTIFQDRSLTLAGGACDGKSGNSTQWDIALQSAAPLPLSGELGSVTGTIYAPSLGADFGDSMSGTTNMAVVTSCIYINGANATFNFIAGSGQLAGSAVATLGG